MGWREGGGEDARKESDKKGGTERRKERWKRKSCGEERSNREKKAEWEIIGIREINGIFDRKGDLIGEVSGGKLEKGGGEVQWQGCRSGVEGLHAGVRGGCR